MSKITTTSVDFQTEPILFELEPVSGKKVTLNFSAPLLSSVGVLTLVREYERTGGIIDRIESCIKNPQFAPMVVHSKSEIGCRWVL